MNASISTTAVNPEDCIDLAISELVLVALQEGLILSDIFEYIDDDFIELDAELKAELVTAEFAKNSHQYVAAIESYDRAIAKAEKCQAIEVQALAHELAAIFYLGWDKLKFATIYMQTARDCYDSWGSRAKTEYLETYYPQLFSATAATKQQPHDANNFTDEFIATLSYEFRTPLASIIGVSEVLLEEVYGELNEQQLNVITTIERNSGYLLSLINNTIDLWRIQAGSLELDISAVSIVELCHASLSFVKPHAIQKQIQLDIDIQAIVADIAVDRLRLRQALINLLNRAIDSTPAGGKIMLKVSEDAAIVDSYPWIKFSIIDTSKQFLRVPVQLERADKSSGKRRNERHKSIGLGLMLVKPIVELHGGVLNFQSEIGRGNCASISLPYTAAIDYTTATQIHCLEDLTALTETLVQEMVESPLILIAEDNELNIDTIASYLNAKGYRTIWADNGAQAIAMTRSEHPDLILMDIQMPEMDGITAIEQIRSDETFRTLPIVALTALAMDGDRDRCLDAGANEYISKPIKLKQLVTIIQQLLSSTRDR
jgi:signal transduction histidine kinase/ActR/RegA family two-component response regulator